jgi:hypothetical protein
VTPKWKDVDASERCPPTIRLVSSMNLYITDNYTQLCTIEADLSGVPLLPQPKARGKGTFYRLDYDMVLLFGMTELKAQLAWKENVSGSNLIFSSQ